MYVTIALFVSYNLFATAAVKGGGRSGGRGGGGGRGIGRGSHNFPHHESSSSNNNNQHRSSSSSSLLYPYPHDHHGILAFGCMILVLFFLHDHDQPSVIGASMIPVHTYTYIFKNGCTKNFCTNLLF